VRLEGSLFFWNAVRASGVRKWCVYVGECE
jgi:hypothetical protein